MSEASRQRAQQVTFDQVTEMAVGGVLRALEVHRKALQAEQLVFKNPPIIYGIWIMPEDLDYGKIQQITGRAAGQG
jgi:hypothetical protein